MKASRLLRASVSFLAPVILAVACQEGSSEVQVRTENSTAGGGGSAAAAVLAQLPFATQISIRHAGLRVFEAHDWSTDTPHTTKFREQIFSDGQGRYAILPVQEIEGTLPDWGVFKAIQEIRQGLIFKYRDFATRDGILFQQNWRLSALANQVFVAGRLCSRYQVDRITGTPRSYTLCVDVETGLILRYREVDAVGQTLSLLEYETVDYAPDLGGVVWYDEDTREQVDISRGFEEQIGFDPLWPTLLPDGYAVRGAEIAAAAGEKWLNVEYSDGVDSLFFLQRFPPLQGRGGGSTVFGGANSLTKADRVLSMQIGSAWALQGNIGGRGLIVVGKVAEVELLDMLESALD